MIKVHIATSRPIGEKCWNWAKENLPDGVELSNMQDCDIFISVMYDQLISEDFIALKKKCFNFHPGILPQYRGAGAFSWAILNGDHTFGITLHEIDTSIDHGEIIAIWKADIESYDTAGSLYAKGEEIIFELFKAFFEKIVTGKYKTFPQDNASARMYFRKDLEKAKDITRIARAFAFPGKEQAYWKDAKGEKHYLSYEVPDVENN